MALDGVGPSIARGSQPEKGTRAAFPAAASNNNKPTNNACPDVMVACPSGHGPAPNQSVKIPCAGQVVQGDGCNQKRSIGNAVHGPHPQAVAHRRGPLVEKRHQQRGRQPHHFPAEKQHLDRPGQRRDHHPKHEERVADAESAVARLAVQIPAGEGPDRAAQKRTTKSQTVPTSRSNMNFK